MSRQINNKKLFKQEMTAKVYKKKKEKGIDRNPYLNYLYLQSFLNNFNLYTYQLGGQSTNGKV